MNVACAFELSELFKLARVFVRLDHVASFIVNADHSITALEIESAQN